MSRKAPYCKALPGALKAAMDVRAVSQARLAERTHIDQSTISQYLAGKVCPPINKVHRLAEALSVNWKVLTGEEPLYKTYHGEARGRYAVEGEKGVVAFADAGSAPWYCPECGRQQEATYKFCPFDGTRKPPEVECPEPARKVEPNVPDPTKPAVQGGRRRAKLEEGSDRSKTGTPQEAQQ